MQMLNYSPFSLLTKLCVFTAIWMSARHNVYGGWPRSGKLDIMESKGNDNYVNSRGEHVGNTMIESVLRCGLDGAHQNKFLWKK